ncbi:MAG: phosphate--AMP phosphotransferase [Firmicutes bacterium]|nr:phosphate--AMP phosphotransferase [Bacillota bacterium]
MLEKIDLKKNLTKEEYRAVRDQVDADLALLQRECKAAGIPVIILFEGWGAAGKGSTISRLIDPLDPRGFFVHSISAENEDESYHPWLWRFWTKLPAKGQIAIFDRSWYRRVQVDHFAKHLSQTELLQTYEEINSFEELLIKDGTVIIKFFLHISKKEQKKRFDKLLSERETSWRVTKEDLLHNKHYQELLEINDSMLEHTDTELAPWTIVEATDREYAVIKTKTTIAARLREALENRKESAKAPALPTSVSETTLRTSILEGIDLSQDTTKEEYKEELEKLQDRLKILHSELYRRRIPVVLAFEGWDAGGKGGAIKRLTHALDPRGYIVHPVSSPNDIEKAHHYLWRFWQYMPKAGHVTIFDRSWYGRVMVERIEGFCSENEWKRAYKEMNEMEESLAHSGAIVIKFWMHIDKDEQERRFKERMENPAKQWKITDEDWRNREKWDQYVVAVDEMLLRTSTSYAPWVIVEGNNKYYARLKVLRTVIDAIEKRLNEG